MPSTTISSYGEGGAGGKLRKKPLRRQTTPYDRPPTDIHANNTNSGTVSSWVTNLVMEPASKLIAYGVDRLFPSVFRRRLPPPLPPEMNNAQESDGDQGEDRNNSQEGEQEPRSGQCSQPINSSSDNGIAELEHMLKRKTFTRSEIAYLKELLLSQVAEVTPGDASQKCLVSSLGSDRKKKFVSSVNISNATRSSAVKITHMHNSKVLESDIASPAELAKAYMGSRCSQVSPSALVMQNQLFKDSIGFLANMPNVSKSPITSLAKRTSVSLSATENGFITPRSRGRSAIYDMARTPYSKVHPKSTLKGCGNNGNGYAGPSTSSSSPSPMENDENIDSRLATLKRRSSVFDDEVGYVGPVRRIRQKPNLLAPPGLNFSAYGSGVRPHSKLKPQLNGEEINNVLKRSGKNDKENAPSTSYAHVPSKSREVAVKILQQLEKSSPREKSSESNIASVQKILPSNLESNRFPGQAIQSMEDVGSSTVLMSVSDYHKSGNMTNGTLFDVHSSVHKQGKAKETSGGWTSVVNNDLKSTEPVIGVSIEKNGASQPQKKRAFGMSLDKDSLKLDDVEGNGLPSRSLPENKELLIFPCAKPAEESRTTIHSEHESFLGFVSRSAREHSPSAGTFGQGVNATAVSTSEGATVPFGSGTNGVASSIPVFDKPNEEKSPNLFDLSSKAADKSPTLSSESVRRAESEPERPSRLSKVTMSINSTPESDTGLHLKPVKAVDTNGNCGNVSPAAITGLVFSSSSPVSSPAASFSDMNQISSASVPLFTSSTSITNFAPTRSSATTTAPSSGSIFGLAVKSPSSVGHDSQPVVSSDQSTLVSDAPTTSFLERADQRAEIDINPSSVCSTSSYSAGSANGIFKFGSSLSNPTGNSLQGSLFATATKFQVSDMGTSLGSLPTSSISFGFSSTSSSDTTSLIPAGGQTSSLFKFSASPTGGSEGAVVSSSTSTTPSIIKFESSSSLSTNTIGSSSGPATPTFSFGGASVSASATNTASAPTGFSFSASTIAEAPKAFNSSTGASSTPIFSFASASTSALSSPSLPNTRPIFGTPPPTGGGFAASPGNKDQMNAEESMAEDPVPSSAPPASPPPSTFTFGSGVPSQNSPFMFNGQQTPQNPSPFQASSSLGFNAGSSFSLGSGGGDKSGRKIVKVSRIKNRKK